MINYPVLAKYIGPLDKYSNKIIVLFTNTTSGVLLYQDLEDNEYSIGLQSDYWVRVDNEDDWKLLTGLDDMVLLL